MVNALQRRADVVVQKPRRGLRVDGCRGDVEGAPVVASRIGGIQDQIVDGESAPPIYDLADLDAAGVAIDRLLSDPTGARAMGRAAHERVRASFPGTRHQLQYGHGCWRG